MRENILYVLGLIMAMVCNSALANKAAIHPYKANEKIQQAAEGAEIFKVDDTFEHVLWMNPEEIKSGDKPYRAWCRAKEIIDGTISP